MPLPGLRGLPLRELARRTFVQYRDDDMLSYAAAMAYHFLFSLFPFLLFLIALLGVLNLQPLFDEMLAWSRRTLPPEALGQVEQVLADVRRPRGDILSLGILGSIWVASVGMRSVMNALNRAYDLQETRPILRRYLLSIAYTLIFALLVVLASSLMVFGPLLAARVAGWVGLDAAVATLWIWLRIPVALLLAMLAVALVYHFAPCVDHHFRFATPGSVVAVLLWALVSVGFQLYISNFGRYSVTYGSVSSVIILLLYLFLSAAMLLLGGEINAVLRRHAPEPDERV